MMKSGIEVEEIFSSAVCLSNLEKIYVFGDNSLRVGNGGQAVIRDCINSFGVVTKLLPTMEGSAFLSDDIPDHKKLILKDLDVLSYIYSKGNTIVFPKAGLGTGLAQMKTRCPNLFDYLGNELLLRFGFINYVE